MIQCSYCGLWFSTPEGRNEHYQGCLDYPDSSDRLSWQGLVGRAEK